MQSLIWILHIFKKNCRIIWERYKERKTSRIESQQKGYMISCIMIGHRHGNEW